MASPKGKGMDGNPDSDLKFPAADADGEFDLRKSANFPVDPISSNVATSKNLKKQAEAEEKQKDKLKSMIILSGVAVAVVAAIFVLSKKLREK